MKKILKNWKNWIFLVVPIICLIVISLFNMKIIGNYNEMYKNYFFKQALWFGLGFIVMGIIMKLKPKLLFKYSKYLYYFNVLLLILVLFVGKTINGSKAWFDFYFFSFQPSELMKFSLTLYLSQILSFYKKHDFKSELKFILKAIFLMLVPSLFVFLEPDTGAIIIYFLITLGIIMIYKIDIKWYLVLGGIVLGLGGGFLYLYYFNKDLLIRLIGTSFFYRMDRIFTFVNKDSFQLDRALIAIGTSGFFSTNHYIYIPEAPTDFIVALSISNLGIVSLVVILLAFLVLDIYFLYKLFKNKNMKYKMFVAGFLMMFIFAQLQNIGMNLGLFPIIGLPLPFVSYGGTNILVYFMFLGILGSKKEYF